MTDTPPRRPRGSVTLLIHCPDRPGIVAAVTRFVFDNGGNITYLDQHVDAKDQVFFMRVAWTLDDFAIADEGLERAFAEQIGERFGMHWTLHPSSETPRMAIFVSRLPHCLYDILSQCKGGDWRVEVPLVVSNHADLEPVARQFGVAFHHLPITPDNKRDQEARQLALLAEHAVEFVVFARYMQIATEAFIDAYPNRIINIHHSFLPAFPGARPYHSAHERGVKVIGATSHYVTRDLDAGPIIEQDIVRISHRDTVQDLVRRGRDLEKIVLSRAIWNHLQRKVLVYRSRTVIFD